MCCLTVVKIHPLNSILILRFFLLSRSVPEMAKSSLVCKIFPPISGGPCSTYIWFVACSESIPQLNECRANLSSETLAVTWVPFTSPMQQKIPGLALPKADSPCLPVPGAALLCGCGLNPTGEAALAIYPTEKLLFRETRLASGRDVKTSRC